MDRFSIFIIFISFVALLQPTLTTTLTYVVEKEVDQADTFVELTAKVQVDGPSLQKSITTARQLIDNIKQIVIKDCENSATKKSEAKKCKDMVEDSKFEVEPKYHLVRKIQTFTLFILTHELTIKVNKIKGLGRLVDQLVQQGKDLITLQEVTWQTQDEIDPQVTSLRDGLVEGKQLCAKIDKVLEEVISVEELEEPEQQQEQDELDPDLTPAEVEKVIFKFKVRCGQKATKKGKKDKKK